MKRKKGHEKGPSSAPHKAHHEISGHLKGKGLAKASREKTDQKLRISNQNGRGSLNRNIALEDIGVMPSPFRGEVTSNLEPCIPAVLG